MEGLDYGKVIAWQQAVDEGRDQWRLDPLEVAKREGKAYYGFGGADTFTVVRTQSASAIARHGRVDVRVKHGDKQNGAPEPKPTAGRVVFRTGRYAGWDWYKSEYPENMAMTVITDYDAQLANDSRIPAAVLASAKDADYDSQVVLFAYLGTGGGADAIGIEKVTVNGNRLTVQVRTRSAKSGELETMMATDPADFVAIDRKYVDVWGGVAVTFVDQHGKVLGKTRVSINHHR